LTGVSEWQGFIEQDCCHIGQPDASFTGGLSEFLYVAEKLGARDRHIATHAWGAGGSLMQNIHCGFAAANTCILEVPPDFGPMHTEIMGDSFRMENGYVLPPCSPGLGIQLTETVKSRFPFVPGTGEFNSVPGKVLTND
jgi:L-alanine-DL-glutamate epimerase-like enolase superfamily enzyme